MSIIYVLHRLCGRHIRQDLTDSLRAGSTRDCVLLIEQAAGEGEGEGDETDFSDHRKDVNTYGPAKDSAREENVAKRRRYDGCPTAEGFLNASGRGQNDDYMHQNDANINHQFIFCRLDFHDIPQYFCPFIVPFLTGTMAYKLLHKTKKQARR